MIQCFEYERLRVGEKDFTQKHFDALAKYNDRHNCRYFDVGYNCIRFKNYVGVIKVGCLTIEILPKIDKDKNDDKALWQNVLLEMLQVANFSNLLLSNKANLKRRNTNLFDCYIKLFFLEVKQLLRHGLQKNYKFKEDNTKFLKGSLLISKHLQQNLVHKERFYTKSQEYSFDNKLNQIIKRSLKILCTNSDNNIASEAKKYSVLLDNIADNNFKEKDFENIKFNRMTKHYQEAIAIAELIICNYQADLASGHYDIIAMLFDMNLLFESYIAQSLKKALKNDEHLKVRTQVTKYFWKAKGKRTRCLKPDIIIKNTNNDNCYVLDAKWKAKSNNPTSDDLRQMYAYSIQFDASNSFLLYPKVSEDDEIIEGLFNKKDSFISDKSCSVIPLEVIDKNGLNNKMLDGLISLINNKEGR